MPVAILFDCVCQPVAPRAYTRHTLLSTAMVIGASSSPLSFSSWTYVSLRALLDTLAIFCEGVSDSRDIHGASPTGGLCPKPLCRPSCTDLELNNARHQPPVSSRPLTLPRHDNDHPPVQSLCHVDPGYGGNHFARTPW